MDLEVIEELAGKNNIFAAEVVIGLLKEIEQLRAKLAESETQLKLAEKVIEAATAYLEFYGGHGEDDDPAIALDKAINQYREGGGDG